MLLRRRVCPTVAALASALALAACPAPEAPPPVQARELALPSATASATATATAAASATASASTPAAADALPLSFLTPRPFNPPPAPAPAPASASSAPRPSGKGGSLRDIQASSGAVSSEDVRSPSVSVDIGLTPLPDLAQVDAKRAASVLAFLKSRVRVCVAKVLASDPTIPSIVLSVAMTSPGGGVAATVAPPNHPLSHAAGERCIEHLLATMLGGDTAPTSLTFAIRIQISGP